MREGMGPSLIKSQAPLLLAAKAVLPHMASFIDEYGEDGLSYLHDLFEEEVLKAVVAGFSDTTADAASVRQATFIIENVNKTNSDIQKNVELDVPGLISEAALPDQEAPKRVRFTKYIPKDR
jgi:hypothetical protein